MTRIARLPLCLLVALAAGSASAQDVAAPATPEQAISRLLGQGLEHAHQRLDAKYSLQPYALVLRKGGAIVQIGGHSGGVLDSQGPDTLFRDPAQVLAELQKQVGTEVKQKADVVAVGFFSIAEIKLPNGEDSSAIQAELEGAAGGCTTVYEPYAFLEDQTLTYGAQIRTKRKGTIFPCP